MHNQVLHKKQLLKKNCLRICLPAASSYYQKRTKQKAYPLLLQITPRKFQQVFIHPSFNRQKHSHLLFQGINAQSYL